MNKIFNKNWDKIPLTTFINEFKKTFKISRLPFITDAQFFHLCYIHKGKERLMACCNNIDEFRKEILYSLMEWYERKKNNKDAFNYELKWAEETAEEIREIFKEN